MSECAGPGWALGTLWQPSRDARVGYRPLVPPRPPCPGRRRAGHDGPAWHSQHPVDAEVGSVGPATDGRAQPCAQQAYNSQEDTVCAGSLARDSAWSLSRS